MTARAAITALVAAANVWVAPAAPPATAQDEPPPADHVVLIGVDGFDPDYLGRGATPNLDALAARGASGVTEGVMLPITNPSFTALTTGAWPDRSGNLAYWWDRAANTYRGQTRVNDVTSIAEAVVDAGGTVGASQYFILQGNGTDYGRAGAVYTQPGGNCDRRFDDALSMLRRQPVSSGGSTVPVEEIPTLLAVYCGELDAIGHDEGAESPNLGPAMEALDVQIGRLLAALDEVGIADRTTIVLTGDHGMSTYTRTFTIPMFNALSDAGFRPQYLFGAGQSVAPTSNVVLVPAGRSLGIYLAGDLAGDPDALARVRAVAEGIEGTGTILDRDAQAALRMHPGHGDLIVESEPGWGAGILPPPGPRGDHGSSAERDAVFVIAGAGIAAADEPVRVRHVDVAPTIAALLGLPPLPDADGRVLTELFERDEPPVPSTTTTSATSTTTTLASSTTTTTSTTIGAARPAAARRATPTYTG